MFNATELLKKLKLQPIDVPADGNCLPYALALALVDVTHQRKLVPENSDDRFQLFLDLAYGDGKDPSKKPTWETFRADVEAKANAVDRLQAKADIENDFGPVIRELISRLKHDKAQIYADITKNQDEVRKSNLINDLTQVCLQRLNKPSHELSDMYKGLREDFSQAAPIILKELKQGINFNKDQLHIQVTKFVDSTFDDFKKNLLNYEREKGRYLGTTALPYLSHYFGIDFQVYQKTEHGVNPVYTDKSKKNLPKAHLLFLEKEDGERHKVPHYNYLQLDTPDKLVLTQKTTSISQTKGLESYEFVARELNGAKGQPTEPSLSNPPLQEKSVKRSIDDFNDKELIEWATNKKYHKHVLYLSPKTFKRLVDIAPGKLKTIFETLDDKQFLEWCITYNDGKGVLPIVNNTDDNIFINYITTRFINFPDKLGNDKRFVELAEADYRQHVNKDLRGFNIDPYKIEAAKKIITESKLKYRLEDQDRINNLAQYFSRNSNKKSLFEECFGRMPGDYFSAFEFERSGLVDTLELYGILKSEESIEQEQSETKKLTPSQALNIEYAKELGLLPLNPNTKQLDYVFRIIGSNTDHKTVKELLNKQQEELLSQLKLLYQVKPLASHIKNIKIENHQDLRRLLRLTDKDTEFQFNLLYNNNNFREQILKNPAALRYFCEKAEKAALERNQQWMRDLLDLVINNETAQKSFTTLIHHGSPVVINIIDSLVNDLEARQKASFKEGVEPNEEEFNSVPFINFCKVESFTSAMLANKVIRKKLIEKQKAKRGPFICFDNSFSILGPLETIYVNHKKSLSVCYGLTHYKLDRHMKGSNELIGVNEYQELKNFYKGKSNLAKLRQKDTRDDLLVNHFYHDKSGLSDDEVKQNLNFGAQAHNAGKKELLPTCSLSGLRHLISETEGSPDVTINLLRAIMGEKRFNYRTLGSSVTRILQDACDYSKVHEDTGATWRPILEKERKALRDALSKPEFNMQVLTSKTAKSFTSSQLAGLVELDETGASARKITESGFWRKVAGWFGSKHPSNILKKAKGETLARIALCNEEAAERIFKKPGRLGGVDYSNKLDGKAIFMLACANNATSNKYLKQSDDYLQKLLDYLTPMLSKLEDISQVTGEDLVNNLQELANFYGNNNLVCYSNNKIRNKILSKRNEFIKNLVKVITDLSDSKQADILLDTPNCKAKLLRSVFSVQNVYEYRNLIPGLILAIANTKKDKVEFMAYMQNLKPGITKDQVAELIFNDNFPSNVTPHSLHMLMEAYLFDYFNSDDDSNYKTIKNVYDKLSPELQSIMLIELARIDISKAKKVLEINDESFNPCLTIVTKEDCIKLLSKPESISKQFLLEQPAFISQLLRYLQAGLLNQDNIALFFYERKFWDTIKTTPELRLLALVLPFKIGDDDPNVVKLHELTFEADHMTPILKDIREILDKELACQRPSDVATNYQANNSKFYERLPNKEVDASSDDEASLDVGCERTRKGESPLLDELAINSGITVNNKK